MRNIVFVGFMSILYACSPSSHSTEYSVSGVVSDSAANGKKIYILRYDDNQYIDSTVIEKNQFTFKGQVDTASYCRIDVDRGVYANFILENGDIRVDLQKHNQPSGTLLNEKVAQLALAEDSISELINRRGQEIREQCGDDERAFDSQMKEFIRQQRESVANKCADLYEGHWDDAFGYALLYSEFFDSTPLAQQKALIAKFGNWLKSTRTVQEISKKIEAQEKTAEGMPYTDITGTDADGKPIALSDFIGKGNYVLMDMWASWCGPCRQEMPNVVAAYKEFKAKGFGIVGISLDNNLESWKKAIKDLNITWAQMSDLKGWQCEGAALYCVRPIPATVLVDQEGTIVARNLRGDELKAKLAELMK